MRFRSRSSMERDAKLLEAPRQLVGVLAILLLAAPVGSVESDGESQDCALARVKPCINTLLEQANNNVIAHATNQTLLGTCRIIREAMECVSSYITGCTSRAERQEYLKTVSSTSGLMDALCQPGDFQDRFLEHVQCLRLVTIDYHYCGHLYKKTVLHIQRGDSRIASPEACCTYNALTNCSRTMSQTLCDADGAEFVDEYLERSGDVALTGNCSRYQVGSQWCPESSAMSGRSPGPLALLLLPAAALLHHRW